MRNADEFDGQWADLTRVSPTYRRPGSAGTRPAATRAGGRPGAGRIRYAHGGPPPGGEPAGPGPAERNQQDGAGSFGGDGQGVGGNWDGGGNGDGADNWVSGGNWDGADMAGASWPAERPAGGRHSDVWVLVCGGIAAAAAFAAAFVASGGAASHPAAPAATVPAVVSQACPSPGR